MPTSPLRAYRVSGAVIPPFTVRRAPTHLKPGGTLCLGVKRNKNTAAEAAEAVRVRRLREDARRSISVNLAEGIALSHQLLRFTGAARRS